MRQRVADILQHSYRGIVASPLVLELMSIYSILFLNGSQPGSCESCLRNYYFELQKNGLKMAESYDKAKTRTLIPNWNGLLYIPSAARHFNSDLINDDEACSLLLDGQLRESHFQKLPDEWIKFNSELKKDDTKEVLKESQETKRTYNKKK